MVRCTSSQFKVPWQKKCQSATQLLGEKKTTKLLSLKLFLLAGKILISTVYSFIFADQRESTNAILFDDCFISQIIIKQFQSSSESSNIILLAIKTEQETF